MVVERDGGAGDDLLALLRDKIASWWIPDAVIDVATMPLAATGKIDKARLRADFADAAVPAPVG